MYFTQADTLLLTIPFVSLLTVWIFRLDDYIFTSGKKKGQSRRPRFANFQDGGEMVMTDPDGRISGRELLHRK